MTVQRKRIVILISFKKKTHDNEGSIFYLIMLLLPLLLPKNGNKQMALNEIVILGGLIPKKMIYKDKNNGHVL